MRPGAAPRSPGHPRSRVRTKDAGRCRRRVVPTGAPGDGQIQGNQSRKGGWEGHGARRGAEGSRCHTGMSHRAGDEGSSSPFSCSSIQAWSRGSHPRGSRGPARTPRLGERMGRTRGSCAAPRARRAQGWQCRLGVAPHGTAWHGTAWPGMAPHRTPAWQAPAGGRCQPSSAFPAN